MTNPTNSGLTKNLLPLWTGHELSESETLELLEEVEGKTDKGKLFNYSNKNTIVIHKYTKITGFQLLHWTTKNIESMKKEII